MIRGEIAKADFKGLDHDPNFHWRGEAVTRIENLSDIAFALALSMLVAGSGTPQTFADLGGFLFSIIPVALGFILLLGIWHSHYTFFRRYGVADNRIIFLNAVLIFVVLYMAYPLRFAFDSLFAFVLMQFGDDSMMVKLGITTFSQSGVIIGYFSIAYAVAHATLALMYMHVSKKRELLALNTYELAVTRREITLRIGMCLLALVAAGLALFTLLNGFAGFVISLTFIPKIIARLRHPLPKTAE